MTATLNSTLALCGGEPVVKIPSPGWPVVGTEEEEGMLEVVRSGKWSWLGANERAFTRDYANYIGTKYAICMANGTVTLQCALQAVGVTPGDEVIVPGMTWVATAQAAMDIGANVVLVDVEPETWCISPDAIRAAITPKTKAIIPVHLYGCMCDMDAIMTIAKEHNLKVVEDVAHQHGGSWRGKKAGSIGDVGSYSFQQSKVLSSGEGGGVTCDDEEVYNCMFALKQVGHMPDPERPVAPGEMPNLIPGNRYGHNYRITEMQCVLLRAGLKRLPDQNRRREEAAARLTKGLERIGGPLRVAKRDPRVTEQAYYALTLHYDSSKADGLHRDHFVKAANAEGARLTGLYPPVYRSHLLNLSDSTSPIPFRDQSLVQDYANLSLPVTERAVSETGVTMPHQFLLGSDEYIDQIVAAVEKVASQVEQIRQYCEEENT